MFLFRTRHISDPFGLEHINEFSLPTDKIQLREDKIPAPSTLDPPHTSHVILGTGKAPVPSKVVNRIQKGNSSKRLSCCWRLTSNLMSSESPPHKTKRKLVTSILEWVQCFGLYTASISKKQPNRVLDLLAYQSLIIDAH